MSSDRAGILPLNSCTQDPLSARAQDAAVNRTVSASMWLLLQLTDQDISSCGCEEETSSAQSGDKSVGGAVEGCPRRQMMLRVGEEKEF